MLILALVLVISALLIAPPVLAANTWTVDSAQPDNSQCASPTFLCKTIQAAISAASPGDTINILNGTYAETLDITQNLAIVGQSQAGVIIDASTFSDYAIDASGDIATVFQQFTLIGSPVPAFGYGIKVAGDNATTTIQNVTVQNSGRSGIDLNGLSGGVVDQVTLTSNGGVGLALTDCDNVAISNVTTSGNAWGGIGIYTYGRYYTGGSDGVSLSGTNSFGEANKLYIEVGNYTNPSSPYPVTNFTQTAFNYTISNGTSVPAYTFYAASEAEAIAGALALVSPASSYVNYLPDGSFIVGAGMSIQAAINAADPGDTVQVRAGTFAENLLINKSLTLDGAGKTSTVVQPTSLLATGVGHKYDANMQVALFVNGAAAVTISDMTIDGNDLAGGNAVVFWNDASGTLQDVKIMRPRPFDGAQTGQGLAVDATAPGSVTLNVVNSDFEQWNKNAIDVVNGNGGVVNGGNITVNVTGGTFTGRGPTATTAQNGILFWERAGGTINGSIQNAVISDIEYTPASNAGSGILQYGSPNGTVSVTGTTFTDVEQYLALAAGSANELDAAGNTFDGVTPGSATPAQLFAIMDKIEDGLDSAGNGAARIVPGYLYVTAASGSIQSAIDLADPGDTIVVQAGTFNETLTVNKRVAITGAGSGAGDTVISSALGGQGGVVQLAASGLSASQPILLKDLRIQPTGMAGISVGLFGQATGVSVSFVELDNVHVVGTNTTPCTEQERGLYIDNTSSLTNLTISDSAFDNLHYGWYFHKQVSADASTVQYVDVENTTFNHNNLKGIYAEKLEDATFTGVTVSQNGYDGSLLGACSYFNPWMAGVDINLKAGAYQNLTFEDITVTSNALGNAKEGVGLTVKARDDGATYGAFPATLNNVLVDGGVVSGNERGIRVGEPTKNNAGPTNVVVQDVCFSGNDQTYSGVDGSAYGGLVNQSLASVDAEYNSWGSATGPTNPGNPGGVGDAVFENGPVDFTPWLLACGGATGNFHNITDNTYFATMQAAVDAASAGDVIVPVGAGPFGPEGSATVTTSGVTIRLSGQTFGPGSPAFTIAANDVTILGPGVIDGGSSTFPGILVQSGAGNFTLREVEVKGWADGIQVAGPVVSLKITESWIHDNADAGLQVDATPSGVITIKGNLFKDNGGDGVVYSGGGLLNTEYNSWGHIGGPNVGVGDGANAATVDFTPWTFSELYMDVDPPANALTRSVPEQTSFDVALKVDAAKLYGMAFKITYDPAKLTLITTTFSAPWAGACAPITPVFTAGVIEYRCTLTFPTAEYDVVGGVIATFNFTANTMPPGNGPWPTYFDISVEPEETNTAAIGGVKVFVNNAGFGAPSVPDRDITDADDGEIIIVGKANYTGFVDLQGNDNDSGAVLLVKNQQVKAGSDDLASGTSVASGAYTTAHLTGKYVLVGSTYYLQFDAQLHLPTTAVAVSPSYPTVPANWLNSAQAVNRPLTTLADAYLLGGDATNNDVVNIDDATCIGAVYLQPFTDCSGQPGSSPDVRTNGVVNIFDLVLMGSNYYLTSSPWTQP
jgi:hypothetical protein